ncbi:leucyl aminopeptidase [Mycoplasma testudineum]|uniref:Probable cytosol aminopeptidase n=1 Tax=Mycoplasma testudineum TaxID=244584 RepID=A0A4R6IDY0_9MOLU|nr:M17 family metallopeptidase [Mycoplasma testudineum]OYD26546.1 peptidase M17 [Mycoplasma testudineum]TDO19115.1 leucyl aminopeptidase [Mycoplasma testudineum]
MNLFITEKKYDLTLKAAFSNDKSIDSNVVQKNGQVTELLDKNVAFLYLEENDKLNAKAVGEFINAYFMKNRFDFQIEMKSFEHKDIEKNKLIEILATSLTHKSVELWNVKTKKFYEHLIKASLLFKELPKSHKVLEALRENLDFTKLLQNMPPNIANSEWIAKKVQEHAKKFDNVKVTVLGREEAIKMGMGLYLSVNKGSMFEPQIVVLEYNNNPDSKDKTVIVGKGITFDSGGYNIKPDKYMTNMKFDMSGAAIAAGSILTLSKTNAKVNAAAVMMLTDNRVNGDASLPDSIVTSMSGMTVEINNTDAEGRLVLADGMTYAIQKLGATELIDLSTLTGAIVYTLANEYTGAWATDNFDYENFEKAAKDADEKVWRMPVHENYFTFLKGSPLADFYNTDYSGLGGSNAAAMFLIQFAENVPYLHLDIAGTAEVKGLAMAAMLKTMVKFLERKGK